MKWCNFEFGKCTGVRDQKLWIICVRCHLLWSSDVSGWRMDGWGAMTKWFRRWKPEYLEKTPSRKDWTGNDILTLRCETYRLSPELINLVWWDPQQCSVVWGCPYCLGLFFWTFSFRLVCLYLRMRQLSLETGNFNTYVYCSGTAIFTGLYIQWYLG